MRERERRRRRRRDAIFAYSVFIIGHQIFLETIKGNDVINCLKDGQSLYLQTRNSVQPQFHKWGCKDGVPNMIILSLGKQLKKEGDRIGAITKCLQFTPYNRRPTST